MFSEARRSGFRSEIRIFALMLVFGGISVSSACAQGFGRFNTTVYGNRGYYPYYGSDRGAYPGYNIFGNYGVYGYPGSGIEGGLSNSGYDPGIGGYPSYGGYGVINKAAVAPTAVPPRRLLGIDEEPVVIADGLKAMKVGKVFPGTAAEMAGLQAGDVIRSVNGYLTEQRGNLAWVIANAAPDNTLKITVQSAKDNQTRVVTANLR